MPKLKVTFEMEVEPMNEEELRACDLTDEEIQGFASAGLSEYDASEIAECVVSALNNEDYIREAFGGSNLFVTVADAKLVGAEIE